MVTLKLIVVYGVRYGLMFIFSLIHSAVRAPLAENTLLSPLVCPAVFAEEPTDTELASGPSVPRQGPICASVRRYHSAWSLQPRGEV